MGTYTASTEILQSVTDAFEFVTDPRNLPYYFPRITSAELVAPDLVRTTAVIDQDGGDDDKGEPVTSDAWFTSDPDAHQITWGSPDNDEYHGSLAVIESATGARLDLSLTTPHDYPGLQESLDEALASIAAKLAGR